MDHVPHSGLDSVEAGAPEIPEAIFREFMHSLPAGPERPSWDDYREAVGELILALERGGYLVFSRPSAAIDRTGNTATPMHTQNMCTVVRSKLSRWDRR